MHKIVYLLLSIEVYGTLLRVSVNRGREMAIIEARKTPKGKTTYRVRIRTKGHPPVSKTFSQRTRAKKWASKTELEIEEGRYFKTIEAQKHTFGQLVDRYIQDVLPDKPKIAKEQIRQLLWWKKHLGKLLLSDITPAKLVEIRDRLKKETIKRGKKETHRSAGTCNRYYAALSSAFSVAVRQWGWLEENPLRNVQRFREPRGMCRFLTENERTLLLDACRASKNSALFPVVTLALLTGMRRGEIMNLTWDRVDLKKGRIALEDTKNGERRVIPLVGEALKAFKKHAKVRRVDTNLVFPSREDPNKAIDLRSVWKTALKKAEIENFRFHDLRHSAASEMVMAGISEITVAEILGHKSLQMTKRYSHLRDAHKAEALEQMNTRLFKE